MPHISKLEMTREEWLALRKHSVGASDVACLLGLNPYKTAYKLWEEKVLPGPPEEIHNDAVEFGNKLEWVVAETFAERSGRKVINDNKVRIHPELDFFTCNLDRVILPQNGEGRGVLECKTASGFASGSWEAEIPPMYYTQVQAQLAITGYTWGALALLVDGRKFKSFDISRDDVFIRSLVQIVHDFWTDHVLAKTPPPAVLSDFERIGSKVGEVAEADESVYAAWQQLVRVKADLAVMEQNKDQLEEKIKLAIGTAEVIEHEGIAIATWKTSKASMAIDTKRLQQEMPDVAKKYEYEKPGTRRFLLKNGAK